MIDILLATFNGEKYIKQQIYSIIAQTYPNWKLIIHDDGSSDSTIGIIKNFAANDNRIVLIEDGVKFGNAGENFMHLLQFSTSEFIMFCDQDDIWFDNKIELMFEKVSEFSSDYPVVAYSEAYVWKPAKGIEGLAIIAHPYDINELLFLNSGIQGCAAIFNAAMKNKLLLWSGEVSMHDHLLHLIGLSIGKVLYIDTPLMLYRQHENATTGSTRTRLLTIRGLLNNSKRPVISNPHYETIVKFFSIYSDFIEGKRSEILRIFINLPSNNYFKRFYLITKYRFKIYNSTSLLLLKTLLRPYLKN